MLRAPARLAGARSTASRLAASPCGQADRAPRTGKIEQPTAVLVDRLAGGTVGRRDGKEAQLLQLEDGTFVPVVERRGAQYTCS